MEERRKDARREPVIVDLEALVPEDHLLRKIERVMITSGCMRCCRHITAMTTAVRGSTRWY